MAEMLCRPVALPKERQIEAARVAMKENPTNAPLEEMVMLAIALTGAPAAPLPPEHLALLTSRYWGVGGVDLTVSFLEKTVTNLRERIVSHMMAWHDEAKANVNFKLVDSGGDIRITLAGSGYWSYLGSDIRLIPKDEPTMCLQDFSMQTPESEYRRVVRHETGHSIGFPHEHLRSQLVSRLDPAKTIAYGARVWGWDEATVRAQVLTPLDDSELKETPEADQLSIMCYMISGECTTDGQPIVGGADIDAMDAAFAVGIYPSAPEPPRIPSRLELLQVMPKGATALKDSKGKKVAVFRGADHTTKKGIYTLPVDPDG